MFHNDFPYVPIPDSRKYDEKGNLIKNKPDILNKKGGCDMAMIYCKECAIKNNFPYAQKAQDKDGFGFTKCQYCGQLKACAVVDVKQAIKMDFISVPIVERHGDSVFIDGDEYTLFQASDLRDRLESAIMDLDAKKISEPNLLVKRICETVWICDLLFSVEQAATIRDCITESIQDYDSQVRPCGNKDCILHESEKDPDTIYVSPWPKCSKYSIEGVSSCPKYKPSKYIPENPKGGKQ